MMVLLRIGCFLALLASPYVLAQDDPEERCGSSGTLAPPQKNLTSVRTVTVSVPGFPDGLAYAPAYGNVAFVALDSPNASIGVLDTTNFKPTVKHQVLLPVKASGIANIYGLALSADQKYLLAAGGYGGYILDAAKVAAGKKDVVAGILNGTTATQQSGDGAFQLSITSAFDYTFVAQEHGANETSLIGNVDVFRLRTNDKTGNVTGKPIGFLSLDQLVTSTVISPDGKIVYATSEQKAPGVFYGTLSVINTTILEKTPSKALISQASAGCGTVRVIVSCDGKVVWTTSRQDNLLLAFDAAKLISDPSKSLLANITVGTSPVGLTFAKNETRILTADGNRFNVSGGTTSLTVVDVHAALAGKKQKSVLGRIPTGMFPRDFAQSPDGKRVLVSDFDSRQVQVVDVETLP